jgi:hypothetical protein
VPACARSASLRNDTEITDENPSLKLPGRPIIYVHVNFPNDGFIAMTRLCTKIDPVWAATIGVTNLPVLAYSGWISINRAQSTAGFGAYVLANPWTLGWWSEVANMRVPSASFINQAGKTVQPNTASVSQAFLELAAKGIVAGGGYDLTHAQSAFAWPVSVDKSRADPGREGEGAWKGGGKEEAGGHSSAQCGKHRRKISAFR